MTSAVAAARTRLWRGLYDIPAGWGPCVVTIGVFDGAHGGHARLIGRRVHLGRELGVPTVLVTFDPHPARLVGQPRDSAALSTPRPRADLALRFCLSTGGIAAAADALGRPHRVEGRLVDGRLEVTPGTAVPAAGRNPAVLSVAGTDARRVDVVADAGRSITVSPVPVPGTPFAALDFPAGIHRAKGR